MTFGVYPGPGLHTSGAHVAPLSTHTQLDDARRAAELATLALRAAMRSHGGTSGGYRVVAATHTMIGHELDRTPGAL